MWGLSLHVHEPERLAGPWVINLYLSSAKKDILRNVNNFINFKTSNLGREISLEKSLPEGIVFPAGRSHQVSAGPLWGFVHGQLASPAFWLGQVAGGQ